MATEATERKKKKNTLGDDNDPPIIITGGGVTLSKASRAKNRIDISYDEPGRARKKIRAKVNAKPNITGVTVVIEGTGGAPDKTEVINFPYLFEIYNVTVTFATGASITAPVKGNSSGSSKKKASSKSASKKSKSK
jgi:hypothetical protein